MMRLLDRYLLRELLGTLAYVLGFFVIIFVAFDLIFGIKSFQEKHLGIRDIAEHCLVTLPEILVAIVIPVSFLVALLYTLTNHSRYNELTAMRAAGVGLWRLAMPYFGVGILLGAAAFAMNELLVPASAERDKEIMHRHDLNPAGRGWIPKLEFHNEGRQWSIDRYNRDTTEMIAPRIIWDRADGSFRFIVADRGIYTNGQWVFFKVADWVTLAASPTNTSPQPGQTPLAMVKLTLPETPAWIESELKLLALSPTEAARKPQLSLREIQTYLRLHPHPDQKKRDMLMTQWQCRLAEPFTCLAVVLIALPFGARHGRQNVFAGVASSLFICFAYFIMQRIGMGLGVAGELPPFLAAWLPNMVISLTGLFLVWRAR